ncbi:hypothetical protein MOD25_05530 [Bacillus haynesii]|uniref:hypothetical protein n=1 Tax=Bacillus haynesii TaxID=1925021 RepID=UPI002281284F|nr:hypothetical protein [Bacillus haynesii]MCY8549362.1 hypothetical protein [Bacillus haynesii]
MEYRNSYGKTVLVDTERDLDGNEIDKNLKYVVSFYIDRDAEVVGIYPLESEGYTKEEILSSQPVKHEVYARDLTME